MKGLTMFKRFSTQIPPIHYTQWVWCKISSGQHRVTLDTTWSSLMWTWLQEAQHSRCDCEPEGWDTPATDRQDPDSTDQWHQWIPMAWHCPMARWDSKAPGCKLGCEPLLRSLRFFARCWLASCTWCFVPQQTSGGGLKFDRHVLVVSGASAHSTTFKPSSRPSRPDDHRIDLVRDMPVMLVAWPTC